MTRRIVTAREQYEMLAPWRVAAQEEHRGPEMYHATMPKNRKSIDQQGLLVSRSEDPEDLGIRGTYMTPTEPERGPWQDVWSIDTSRLKHLEPDDPGQAQEFGGSFWTKHDVPRDAMRLHYQAEPDPGASEDMRRMYFGSQSRTARRVMSAVTLFTKPGCFGCKATARELDKHGIPFTSRDVTQDPEAYAHVQSLGYAGLPVVHAGEDNHWSGHRPDRVRALALP